MHSSTLKPPFRHGHRLRAALALVAAAAVAAGSAARAQAAPPIEQANWTEHMACGADAARPDARADVSQRYVLTPRGAIAYYRFGHGSPIVLVTGYRATIANWNAYFLEELARRHDVIVFDNRGIGGSTSPTADYGMADLAGDTVTLMQTLRLRDVTLVGWSMGGMIAQTVLMQHPGQVRHAVLMNTAPPGPHGVPVPEHIMRVLSGAPGVTFAQVMSVLFPPDAQAEADRCFARDMFRPADYRSTGIPAQVTRSQDAVLQAWAKDASAYARLRRIDVPTLVAAARDDAVLAPRNSIALRQAMRAASILEAADAGHAMMYQYPRALARRISTFAETGR